MSRCVRGSGPGWRCTPPWGYSAHTGRILGRHKNDEYAAVTRGRPAFQRHEAHAEGSDTTPHIEVPKKCKTGVFITAPNRAPAETQRSGFGGKRTSDRESESCRLRRDEGFVVRSDDGEGFVVRSDDGQHRICLVCGEAAALPNALGGAWPHTPFPGGSPHPLKAASVSAERLLPASGGAASKGDQSPFEEPPALRGDERNHFRKVIDYEKRYQIQHAHGVR